MLGVVLGTEPGLPLVIGGGRQGRTSNISQRARAKAKGKAKANQRGKAKAKAKAMSHGTKVPMIGAPGRVLPAPG